MPAPRKTDCDDMRAEYDFSGGIRGTHVERMKTMRLKVRLDPDVAQVFGTSKAANEALRTLARIGKAHARKAVTTRRKKVG